MATPQVTAWSLEPGGLSEGTLTAGASPDKVRTMELDWHVGAVAPVTEGGYVLAAGQGVPFVDEAGSVHELAQPEAGHAEVRTNDGACDPQGRFWAGTMAYDESPGAGTLAPDGLTVDEQADIRVALYGGWAVNRHGPEGSLRAGVQIPVAQATCCAFGGDDRGTVFVTTGRERLEEAALERRPDAGRVFAVAGLGAREPASAPYRGRVPSAGSSG